MSRQKYIIPLLPYVNPKEPITKRSREENNNIFYKKIKLIRIKNNKNRILSPIKRTINLSLPKIRINSIDNNKKKKYSKEKSFEKFFSFDDKLYLKCYENAITNVLKTKPKKNFSRQNPYEALLLKGRENYRKINKIKLNKENLNYRNNIKNISSQFSNSSSYHTNINNSYLCKKIKYL